MSIATSEPGFKLESRVAILEAKITQLQDKLATVAPEVAPWWEYVVGAFAGDPAFEEAMRLGRAYRESRPPRHRLKSTTHKKKAKTRKR